MSDYNLYFPNITKSHYDYFFYLNISINILYFLLIIGFEFINIIYVQILILFVHISICIFLMLRFNRFVNGNVLVNMYEKKLIFSGSLVLLINILIYQLHITFTNKITYIVDYIKNIVKEYVYN